MQTDTTSHNSCVAGGLEFDSGAMRNEFKRKDWGEEKLFELVQDGARNRIGLIEFSRLLTRAPTTQAMTELNYCR